MLAGSKDREMHRPPYCHHLTVTPAGCQAGWWSEEQAPVETHQVRPAHGQCLQAPPRMTNRL